MLSKGGAHGGGVKRQPRFQQIVNTVADLPSPLDTEPGTRVIVRESEEVFGLDKTTRMWSVIGSLKKVGGKPPEEIAAHVDSEGNPHKTSFQDVLDTSSTVAVTEGILITGKGPTDLLRLMSGRSALRIGPDAGNKEGALWINAGNGTGTPFRLVDGIKGEDLLVITGNGSISSSGYARFAGGFKGPAHFEDKITASEGVESAAGFDLVLSGGKNVVLRVGDKASAQFSKAGLKLNGALDASGGLRIKGLVRSSLNPDPSGPKISLGVSQARWSSAAVGDLDLAGQLIIKVPANSQTAPLLVEYSAPGNVTTLSPTGRLGLGTDKPEARLDVRGALLVGSGKSRLRLDETGLSCGGWIINPILGDGFNISNGKQCLFQITDNGTELWGDVKTRGSLSVTGGLEIGAVHGLADQAVVFVNNGSTSYKSKTHRFSGNLEVNAAKGKVPFTVNSDGDTLLIVDSDGALLGTKLGSANAPWDSAYLEQSLRIRGTALTHGKISHVGEFTIDAHTLVAENLRLLKSPKIEVLNTLRLQGANGAAVFTMGGPNCGVSFEGKSWELLGVDKLDAGQVKAKSVSTTGNASFCDGKIKFAEGDVAVTGDLHVAGLGLKHHVEDIDLSKGSSTKFQLPVGVRVEAVLVRLNTEVGGVRFLMVGDPTDPNRFSGPSTDLSAGALIRGMDHWAQSRMVQKVKAPIVVSGDAAATGHVTVTIHYVDPAAF